MTEIPDIEMRSDGTVSVQGLMDRVIRQEEELTALRAENERLRDAFYFAWSCRPMLGKTWDGESDPLALVMAAMDAALTEKGGRVMIELTKAAQDVLAERKRQIEVKGWSSEHDDKHDQGELADAAGCYALFRTPRDPNYAPPRYWPWDEAWWKPVKDKRRNLVKAAALLLAEIERLDRAALTEKGGE